MTAADALKILMDAWNLIRTTVRDAFPDLTEDEVYEIAKGVGSPTLWTPVPEWIK